MCTHTAIGQTTVGLVRCRSEWNLNSYKICRISTSETTVEKASFFIARQHADT